MNEMEAALASHVIQRVHRSAAACSDMQCNSSPHLSLDNDETTTNYLPYHRSYTGIVVSFRRMYVCRHRGRAISNLKLDPRSLGNLPFFFGDPVHLDGLFCFLAGLARCWVFITDYYSMYVHTLGVDDTSMY